MDRHRIEAGSGSACPGSGFGSGTGKITRFRLDPDPQHGFYVELYFDCWSAYCFCMIGKIPELVSPKLVPFSNIWKWGHCGVMSFLTVAPFFRMHSSGSGWELRPAPHQHAHRDQGQTGTLPPANACMTISHFYFLASYSRLRRCQSSILLCAFSLRLNLRAFWPCNFFVLFFVFFYVSCIFACYSPFSRKLLLCEKIYDFIFI